MFVPAPTDILCSCMTVCMNEFCKFYDKIDTTLCVHACLQVCICFKSSGTIVMSHD
jgi:hypothetical protein